VAHESSLEVSARGELTVHVFSSLAALGVDAFVTDRYGGVSVGPYAALNLGDHVGDDDSAVTENRRRVANAVGVSPERLTIVRQVHGARVATVQNVTADTEADALVVDDPEYAAAILVADCVPLVIASPTTRQLAVIHAGWRGLAAGVIAAAAREVGGDPQEWRVGVGPSISAEGYQVGPEVAQHFAAIKGAVRGDVGDRSRVDLRRVTVQQLLDVGVVDDHITLSTACTDGGDLFFSDRAQRPCGRFALVARWP